MNERRNQERMNDEAEEWFYDLGKLAQKVNSNYALSKAADDAAVRAYRKAEVSRKRLRNLALFVLFAFLLLAWRSEVGATRLAENDMRITKTQQKSCQSGLEILIKFNRQNDALIEVERSNQFINDAVRAARIKAYREARIDPLPICIQAR